MSVDYTSAFLGVLLGACLHDLIVDSANVTSCIDFFSCLPNDTLKSIDDDQYIKIPEFTQSILHSLGDGWSGGLKLIAAPAGSGKSTILLKEIVCLIGQDCFCKPFCRRQIVVIPSLMDGCIHEALKIRPDQAWSGISSHVAEKTLIIFPRVDCGVAEVQALSRYIVSMATDGYNSDRYTVFMCVSNPETFRQISEFHIEKIYTLCEPSLLTWDSNRLKALIDSRFPAWSEGGKKRLLDLSVSAMSPGPIDSFARAIRDQGFNDFSDVNEVFLLQLISDVEKTATEWGKFGVRRANTSNDTTCVVG
jgi:hypothetical protein